MDWTPLQSSNLSAYRYDADMKVLHLRFKAGSTYAFADVPPETVEGLKAADSPGKYFREQIRFEFKPVW